MVKVEKVVEHLNKVECIPELNGCIMGEDERDLMGGQIEINWDKIPKKLADPKTTINQGKNKLTSMSCTMAGALMQIGQIYDFEVDNELLIELCNFAVEKEGRDPKRGRLVSAGNNTVKNFVKEKFGYDVVFIRVKDDTYEYEERNKRNGLIGISYRSCSYYESDRWVDSIVQGKGDKWKKGFGGHRTNWYKDGVLDSYYGRKNYHKNDNNFYKVLHPSELRKNFVYNYGTYIFLKKERVKNNYEKMLEENRKETEEKKKLIKKIAPLISELWEKSKFEESRKVCHEFNEYRRKVGLLD